MIKKLPFSLTLAGTTLVSIFLLTCNSGSGTSHTGVQGTDQNSTLGNTDKDLKISLAQWSLQRTFIGDTIKDWGPWVQALLATPDVVLKGEVDPMDFPSMAKGYGIDCIELLNIFYYRKAKDQAYWERFKKKCDDAGVTVGLIMCDVLGNLGDADQGTRLQAVENHYPWVDVARFLGARSVRVNLSGEGTPEEVATYAVDGLTRLAEYAAPKGISIIVENQRGLSSDASGSMTVTGALRN